MSDFFELDFLDVETGKSGDAITIHYEVGGRRMIHVVDGGFDAMAPRIIDHIVAHYGNKPIDHVVVTHPDGDHACGLRGLVERCNVGTLWMLRPWLYAEALLPLFPTYTSADRLAARLRKLYPYIADLERIAEDGRSPSLNRSKALASAPSPFWRPRRRATSAACCDRKRLRRRRRVTRQPMAS